MKTIGEIIHSARQSRNFTREQLSHLTKIDTRYIEALERNEFGKLPPATFTKGFVRNLALALEKDPLEWIAIFRRDYHSTLPVKAHPLRLARRFSLGSLFQSQITIFVLGVVVFVTYLGFQYRAVLTPPPLEVSSPAKDAVVISPITINGQTVSGTTITINDDLKITPDVSGNFVTKLNLPTGSNQIKVSAISRFSRTTTKTIDITVLSQ